MFFTKEDYIKILLWLNAHSIKDTDFPRATAITNEELIPIVLDGKNKTIPIKDILNIGKPGGLVPLGESGIIPLQFLPQYVAKTIEVDSLPSVGDSSILYVIKSTGLIYRWSGTQFISVSSSLVLGTVTGTAYDGGAGAAIANKIACLECPAPEDMLNITYNTGETGLITTSSINLPTASRIQGGSTGWTKKRYLTIPTSGMNEGRVLFCKEGIPYWDKVVIPNVNYRNPGLMTPELFNKLSIDLVSDGDYGDDIAVYNNMVDEELTDIYQFVPKATASQVGKVLTVLDVDGFGNYFGVWKTPAQLREVSINSPGILPKAPEITLDTPYGQYIPVFKEVHRPVGDLTYYNKEIVWEDFSILSNIAKAINSMPEGEVRVLQIIRRNDGTFSIITIDMLELAADIARIIGYQS